MAGTRNEEGEGGGCEGNPRPAICPSAHSAQHLSSARECELSEQLTNKETKLPCKPAVPVGLRKYPAQGQESTEPAELLSQEAAEHKVHGTVCPRGARSLVRGHPSARHLWGLLLSPLPGPGLARLLPLPSTPPRPLVGPQQVALPVQLSSGGWHCQPPGNSGPGTQKARHAPCSAP